MSKIKVGIVGCGAISDAYFGTNASFSFLFDGWGHGLPPIEIYGTEGTLSVPDPNGFGGTVKIRRGWGGIEEVPLTHGYTGNARGIGMADMILAMQNACDHRCNERVACHVLDVMHAFHDANDQRMVIALSSSCERPAALPAGLCDGELEPRIAQVWHARRIPAGCARASPRPPWHELESGPPHQGQGEARRWPAQ